MTTPSVCDALEKKLNIKISDNVRNECPQFLQLLEKLAEKINTNGLSKVRFILNELKMDHFMIGILFIFSPRTDNWKLLKKKLKTLGKDF